MGTFSIWHWLIVLAVVLVLFGGRGKISSLMGDFGKGLKSFNSVEDKTIVYWDGHTDTVQALRPRWIEAIGGGIDARAGQQGGEQLGSSRDRIAAGLNAGSLRCSTSPGMSCFWSRWLQSSWWARRRSRAS